MTQSHNDQHATSVDPVSGAGVTGHEYDGIMEYDNPLPGWWSFLFWFFIVIAPVYVIYFHGGQEGRSIHDEYNSHMAAVFEKRFKEIGVLKPDRETLIKYMNDDPKWLAVGEVVYKTNCISCHGASGEGLIGPNLTDDNWLHVRNIEDIAKIISDGANNGAMPAWKTRFSHPNQIVLTAAYVASMRKNPVQGKKAEGNKIGPWVE